MRGAVLLSRDLKFSVDPNLTILIRFWGAQGTEAVEASQKALPKKGLGNFSSGEGGQKKE